MSATSAVEEQVVSEEGKPKAKPKRELSLKGAFDDLRNVRKGSVYSATDLGRILECSSKSAVRVARARGCTVKYAASTKPGLGTVGAYHIKL